MSQPEILDAYGKAIKVGDTILYPVVETLNDVEIGADFVEFVVVGLDVWFWSKEWCDKFGFVYDAATPPGFVLDVVEATDYVTLNDPDDMFRMSLSEPYKAIVITGLDLAQRHRTPQADRKGYWTRPNGGTKKK